MPEIPGQTAIDAAAIDTIHIPNAPIGATKAWRERAILVEFQCEHATLKRGATRPTRCDRTLTGGHRLFLGADGRLRCKDHDTAKFGPPTKRGRR